MHTKLLDGVIVPSYDYRLLQEIPLDPEAGGDGVMKLAIRNHSGEIYRVIELSGLESWNQITAVLADMGMCDDIASRPARLGYDAIFTPQSEHTLQGN